MSLPNELVISQYDSTPPRIANFADLFEDHFNDTGAQANGLEPRSLLTATDPLFYKLVDLQKSLGLDKAYVNPNDISTAPTLTWRDAEVQLSKLKSELRKHRCHMFKPSAVPEDDEFDYMQLHHVEHFLAKMIWHAKLNSSQEHIRSILSGYRLGKLGSLETIEGLEQAEGDGIFPSFWLFQRHVDDYRYGD